MSVTVTVGGTAITSSVLLESLRIENSGGPSLATCTFDVVDKAGTITVLIPEAVVVVADGATVLFGGLIRSRTRIRAAGDTLKRYSIGCQDYTSYLTDDVIDDLNPRTTTESDKTRIEYLIATYGTHSVTTGATVQTITASMPEQTFTGMTLYEAIADVARLTGGQFYVGSDLKLHYFATESYPAPWNFSDSPNGTTTFSYQSLTLPDDTVELVNAVFVVGTDVSGWVTDAASITAYGRHEGGLRDTSITTAAMVTAAGTAYLAERAYPRQAATITTTKAGLLAGMTVTVTDARWGLAAQSFTIAKIVGTLIKPDTFSYEVQLSDGVIDIGTLIGGGTTANRKLLRSTNVAADYALSLLGRVIVVAALPALPDAAYPQGQLVLLTGDGKLYRNTTGSAWSKAVDGVDLVADSVTAGAVAAGAIGTEALAVGGGRSMLIDNGDFERGTANVAGSVYGWNVSGAGAKIVSAAARGKQSASLAATAAYDAYIYSGLFPVRVGDTVYVSAFSRAIAGSAGMQLDIQWKDSADGAVSTSTSVLSRATGGVTTWVESTGSAVAPATTASALVVIYSTTASSTVGIDEVVVRTGDYMASADGNVVIDSTGITINNGKLTFKDAFGSTAMDGDGFGAAWVDFIKTGLYNSSFQQGALGAISASSVPNWTAALTNATASVDADANYPSGRKITVTPSATNGNLVLTSDLVPVTPGCILAFEMYAGWTLAGTANCTVGLEIQTYLADGTTVVTSWASAGGCSETGTATSAGHKIYGLTFGLFPRERYVQLRATLTETVGHSASTRLDLGLVAMVTTTETSGIDPAATLKATKLTASDMVIATGGMRTLYKAGSIGDGDFTDDADGNFGIDGTNHRLWIREAAAWHYIARTAGITIPVDVDGLDERICPQCGRTMALGERVVARIEGAFDDGALHGLWEHLTCPSVN